ncbi:iron complex transport system permease protein [Enterococcus sp. PF1-24]|uniref:ABC transporter permease n=1 Tax=unclassified Enterococcus TaxID=2608891 RepID=UPI002474E7B5|nr:MULTISPECIES: iron chelate uptake ABC transporter family permease subunit [unclassified Enterococcus]MDH6363829.1 iron complex transport system permease protein [Enterococcus sp. PFB1-1]MDH6400985.1 iron complex transport system permease protein [Enterococcus sp. PF1-24]
MKKVGLFILLILLVLISLFVGVKDMDFSGVLNDVGQQRLIFFTTRIPRTISLVLAGATMSVCGLVMQHSTQNKFVSPTTAGTMASARLGIVFVMIFLPSASTLLRSLVAFLFAFLGTLAFLGLSRFLPGKNQMMLPLVGVMFGNIIGSIATFFAYQFQVVQNMSAWLQGNFATVMKGNYELLYLTIPVFIAVYGFAYAFTIVGLGEDFAKNLGLNYRMIQLLGILLIAIASGIVLIMVGTVTFLGVVVPNIIAQFYGDHMQKTLGLTALAGSIFLLSCDIIARLVIAPYEIPVSVVVGIIGSLLFILLLTKGKKA